MIFKSRKPVFYSHVVKEDPDADISKLKLDLFKYGHNKVGDGVQLRGKAQVSEPGGRAGETKENMAKTKTNQGLNRTKLTDVTHSTWDIFTIS